MSGMDKVGVERVLSAYGTSILHLAYSYLRCQADAEDVLQDTLVKYMQSAPAFAEQAQEKAWLYRVAINLCKNRLKAPPRRAEELPEDYPSDGIPEEAIGIYQAVNALPEKYREVVHLFYYEDATTAQIAGALGKRETTVRSLLFRARQLLREELEA
jgi:RNA polymerase sigma factor (sigma-70 family)